MTTEDETGKAAVEQRVETLIAESKQGRRGYLSDLEWNQACELLRLSGVNDATIDEATRVGGYVHLLVFSIGGVPPRPILASVVTLPPSIARELGTRLLLLAAQASLNPPDNGARREDDIEDDGDPEGAHDSQERYRPRHARHVSPEEAHDRGTA